MAFHFELKSVNKNLTLKPKIQRSLLIKRENQKIINTISIDFDCLNYASYNLILKK